MAATLIIHLLLRGFSFSPHPFPCFFTLVSKAPVSKPWPPGLISWDSNQDTLWPWSHLDVLEAGREAGSPWVAGPPVSVRREAGAGATAMEQEIGTEPSDTQEARQEVCTGRLDEDGE